MKGIYKITNPKGRVYIGQSINIKGRWKNYSYKNTKRAGPKLLRSLNKYGYKNHTFEILEECKIKDLNKRETYWKKYYLDKFNNDWENVLFHELYDKGAGPHTKATKKKMSKSHMGLRKGVKFTEEHKKKISEAKKGFVYSPEQRNNISKGRKGIKHSKDTKKRMSEYWTGTSRPHLYKPILQYDLDGNFIKRWDGTKEAATHLNLNITGISHCLNKKQKTAYNFKWTYENNSSSSYEK